jgi:isochorismate pyruvate lyase
LTLLQFAPSFKARGPLKTVRAFSLFKQVQMTQLKPPADCMSKTDIRKAIDSLDDDLLQIFARRQGYVRRMAQLKKHPGEAFDHERIETMVAKLKARAEELGLEGEQAETVWRTLIDWNVAYERAAITEHLSAREPVSNKGTD